MKSIEYSEKKINLFIILSLVIHLNAALFSIGSYNPDEHFCILEYVNTKFGFDADPCFQQDRIRSWFQPFVYYLISKILIVFNITDSFSWAFFYRLFSSILGWLAIILTIKNNTSIFSAIITRNIFIYSSIFFWFFPFLHARTSAENFGTSFLLIGISILLYLIQNKLHHKMKFLFLAGIVLGLSFISRYQIGIMILFFLIWASIYKKFSFKELILITLGIIVTILFEIIINLWGYKHGTYPWGAFNTLYINGKILSATDVTNPKNVIFVKFIQNFPYLNYFYYMIFVAEQTTEKIKAPWWYYSVLITKKFFPPLSIIVILCFVYLWIFLRKNFITWITIPYIIIHSINPHKEFRYMFPVLVLFPFVLSYILEDIILNKKYLLKLFNNIFSKFLITFFLSLNILGFFIISFIPINYDIKFYKYIDKLKNINNFYFYNNKELLNEEIRDPFYEANSQLYFYHRSKTIDTFSNSYNLNKKYEEKIIQKKKSILMQDRQNSNLNKSFFNTYIKTKC